MKIAEKNTKLHEELDETQRQLNSQERDKNIEFFENDYTYDKQLKEYLIKEANGYDDIASRMFSADTKIN